MASKSYTSDDEARAAAQLANLRGTDLSFMASAADGFSPASAALSDSGRSNVHSVGAPSAEAGPSKGKPTEKPRSKSDASIGKSSNRSDKEEDHVGGTKSRKRRRVVVACDTCRRKKVKCEGLPNPTNTCNNCSAYNYRCTFSSEPDRSRGKYEILESKVETLLSALRSVAPHIAAQYDKGELTITGPSGGSAPPQNATGWRNLQPVADGEYDELDPGDHDADGGRPTHAGGLDAGDGEPGGSGSNKSDRKPSEEAAAAAQKQNDRDGLIPDVEEGRPRYFGHSSTLSLFHSLPAGKHSRPPSPGAGGARPRYPGNRPQIFDSYEASSARARVPGESSSDSRTVRFSTKTARPLHPTNSKEWIQLLRRKNTVAVGRDDLNTEEWLTRYTLPAPDLVSDLLNLYFERLDPLMPIVHRPSLERDIATGRADKDVAFRGMVFTLLTIASRHSRDPRVYSDPNDPDTAGDHFAAASRLYHQVYAASLTNVQVMILTATFMHGAIGPGASWTVLGVAIRALQDIGLHQERAYRDFSPFDQEIRRRVFWGALILDSIFSINMGRPPGLRMEDCDVRMPLDIDDETLSQFEHGGPITFSGPPARPTPYTGFIHMIKLNLLVKDIVSTLYTQRWRHETGGKRSTHSATRHAPDYKDMAILSRRLDQWVADTPEHLRSLDSPYKLQAGLVQCGAHDVRLYILKPFLEHAALKKILHPQCSHHARECLKVVVELYEGGHVTDLVFIFQQALMSTATFMITVWHECRDGERLAEDNDLIEATLRTFGSFDDRFFSKIFRRAHRILRNIATRTIHTMTSDQRERVSRLLQREGEPVPSLFAGSMLLGPSNRLLLPGTNVVGGAMPSRLARRTSSDVAGTLPVKALHAGINGMAAAPSTSASMASSIIPSWSPWGPGAQSPARGSIDYTASAGYGTHGIGGQLEGADGPITAANPGASSTMATSQAQPAASWATMTTNDDESGSMAQPYPDPRGLMPLFTPATDDVRATAHQLEDLTWTDYFSKFLDDIGGANQPGEDASAASHSGGLGAVTDLPFAVGTPGSISVSGGTPRRFGA